MAEEPAIERLVTSNGQPPYRISELRDHDLSAIDWELLFCSHVLRLPALHWGAWRDGDPQTLEGLRMAQRRFSQRVVQSVPDHARSVLDVGCGQGDNARLLAARGCMVTALAPIANYRQRLLNERERGISFQQIGIESFVPQQHYDAVLMSESCGCFTLEVGHRQSARALRPGGALIVANMFRKDEVVRKVARHRLDDFLASAARHGFTMKQRIDITDQVLPTLTFFCAMYDQHIRSAVEFGELYVRALVHKRRWIGRMVGALTRSWRKRLQQQIADYVEQLDPRAFRQHATYEILVLERGVDRK